MENHKDKAAAPTLPPRTELTAHDVLVAARALIEMPGQWCQGSWNAGGRCCAAMALSLAWGNSPRAYDKACAHLEDATGGAIITFNDSHTHTEVLAAFDKAIAECSP